MTSVRRRRAAEGTPIAVRLRQMVLLFWALLLLVCLTAVVALQVQANEVNQLTLSIGPAYDANVEVLQGMTEADAGLLRYQASRDVALLGPLRAARARTMTALDVVENKDFVSAEDVGLDQKLEKQQRLAVEQWWTYALSTGQPAAGADRTDVLRGDALLDSFRRANAALGQQLKADRAQSRVSARTTAAAGTAVSIGATLAALLVAFILGGRVARSISAPMIGLRDTMIRQRGGEPGVQAREGRGPLELRSLAVGLNALTEQNLRLQEAQSHALRMHELAVGIARAVRASADTQQALDVICAALGEGLGVDRVMANTIDADHKVLLGAQWHLTDLPPLGDIPDDLVPHVGQLAEELWRAEGFAARDDFLAPEVQSRERSRIFHRVTGARAVIMVPIGLGDRVIGMIYVLTVREPRGWTPPEVNVVQQVAGFVARVVVEAEHRSHQSEYVARLERLDRQKTDFLSTVSHELRTPLTSISGYLELLLDGDAGQHTAEQHRMFEVIDRNTSRLRGLIEDLLVLNRIEGGGLKVNAVAVRMGELIAHTAQELSPLAHGAAVELDIEAGPEAAMVQGDGGHLHRAVVNIVSNAIKFSRPGGVVTVRCLVDENAGRVLVTCQDEGIGIPVQDQGQLFTRFYRASNATEQAIPGTGLGLTIVKQIVEDHGGELRLTSVEGEGTTVVMDLPLSVPANQVDGNHSHQGDVFGIRA